MLDDGTDRSDETWDRVAECIDAYASRCDEEKRVVSIASQIPEGDRALQRLVASELVKLGLQVGYDFGDQPKIEELLVDTGDLFREHGVPLDLVVEEIQIRADHGHEVLMPEYEQRFPHLIDRLLEVVGQHLRTFSARQVERVRELEPDDEVDDFVIIRRLGTGSFAAVYLARTGLHAKTGGTEDFFASGG